MRNGRPENSINTAIIMTKPTVWERPRRPSDGQNVLFIKTRLIVCVCERERERVREEEKIRCICWMDCIQSNLPIWMHNSVELPDTLDILLNSTHMSYLLAVASPTVVRSRPNCVESIVFWWRNTDTGRYLCELLFGQCVLCSVFTRMIWIIIWCTMGDGEDSRKCARSSFRRTEQENTWRRETQKTKKTRWVLKPTAYGCCCLHFESFPHLPHTHTDKQPSSDHHTTLQCQPHEPHARGFSCILLNLFRNHRQLPTEIM